ncbi:ECF transporter S component [Apilactobacillus timberlakei]|uniref:Riboflavin transporter n=1 Tax=Apilactobacillus timberlakei TaxID=2008380 RepID=A0ABY2YTT7_9LACO|nr:ECF transporter S component [Apilactobacillus timberlakei]TPR13885.1 ECF transporter S component [Apilactobacillus timberlakei]TPR15201.1 ECF transporter S component [Apilactobacillus timberlakei]TPR17092.1 ECF transporter S component [Apilactobacillus timberlakei]TPR17494.1 ECF transporter S component [Apilactobacillus timberlakei]TPR20085.1 ECF transporter S component [Apilactobacillus timberlakei]
MFSSNKFSLQRIVQISILSGLAYLLSYISVSIIPIAPYMKLDFGDIPILLATILLSTSSGIIVSVMRAFLYFIFTGPSIINLIGVSSLLLASLTIVLSMSLVDRLFSKKIKYVLMVLFETISLTLIMSLANYFIITPLYINLAGFHFNFSLADSILYVVIPFNIIKGLFIGIVFVIILNRSKVWSTYKKRD